MYDEDHLDRKQNVLIAGASSGLGRKLYESYCDHWTLDGLGGFSRTITPLDFDAYKSPIKHNTPLVWPVDATDYAAVDEYVTEYEKLFGPVTHLVCTLGVYGPLARFVDCDIEEWMVGVENNLFGPAVVAQRVLPNMIKERYGKIVFLSGGGATRPIVGATSYCAGKSALVRFAEALAHEVYEYSIDVNCVAPGLMPTRFVNQAIAAGEVGSISLNLYAESVASRQSVHDCFVAPIALIQNLLSVYGNGISGNLISAVHDDFWQIPKGLNEQYSLRRAA